MPFLSECLESSFDLIGIRRQAALVRLGSITASRWRGEKLLLENILSIGNLRIRLVQTASLITRRPGLGKGRSAFSS